MTRYNNNSGNGDLHFADELWKTANKLRGSVESAEYKHIVLGLLFLKYISDAFEERQQYLIEETHNPDNPDYYTSVESDAEFVCEDKDEYLGANIFWVPKEARWSYLMENATQPNLGKLIDEAMLAIEREYPKYLKGLLPKIYAHSAISSHTLGEIVNLFSNIGFGTKDAIAKDVLGRTYEYFIKMFAKAEGHRGGEFYTPKCVVRLIVEILEPYEGRIYDPACGSGGMFVQSLKFIQAHNGNGRRISIYGQELNEATWRICKMNLAIRGLEGNIALGNTFFDDRHRDLRADYILTNPPFNMKEWGADRVVGDVRLKYGRPPNSNANYMWIQHFIHHLSPNGMAGFVMANGSMSVGGVEGEIRQKIIEGDLVDCIVACPPQLFFTTQIPVCLWFVTKDKVDKHCRNRQGEILFIDARKLFVKISRIQNDFTDEHIAKIAGTYHAWRGEKEEDGYKDISGFCKSITLDDIRSHGYVLTPGRYVGTEEVEDDGEPFEEKMNRLIIQLAEQFKESGDLQKKIRTNLKELGFNIDFNDTD